MPLLFLAVPLLAVVVLNIIVIWVNEKVALWAGMVLAVGQMGLASYDIVRCLETGSPVISVFLAPFSVDLISAVVLFIIGLIFLVTLMVSRSTVKKGMFNFVNMLYLIIIGMNGVVMVTDLFSLYVFIEVVSAASFVLIAFNKKKDELEGAFKYYLMSAVATVFMLSAIAFLFMNVGDTSFAAVGSYIASLKGSFPIEIVAALILYTVALAIKSGVVPFHTWVPDAHSSAPSPVSVILAGVVIKVSGVYAMMRVFNDAFAKNSSLGIILIVLGLISVIVGALAAMGQTDIKRMLAFSSVSQIGYMMLGVGTGSVLGLVGALFHFFNHSTFKSLLFVDSAAIVKQTGTRDMTRMGGLAEKMPVTGVSSVIGLLSMAGIPPLSGFWSKLLIIMAVWAVSPLAGGIALVSSVLTLGYALRLQKKVFYGKTVPEMQEVKECGRGLMSVEILLSAVNVLAGILFPFLLLFLQGRGIL